MKQILSAILLASSSMLGFYAQNTSNLVIFAEDPKPFYAIVNGIKQNAEPQTNVKITGLTNPSSSIKVVFADGTPDLNKTTWFETMGKEVTLRIVNTKKGYKLRYFGEIDINNSVENTEQVVVTYHTEEVAPAIAQPVETVTVTEQVVTTTNSNPTVGTTINSNPSTIESENVNMDINLGGFGVSMNVNVNETNGSTGSTTTTNDVDYSSTTTTTTTTTTSSSSGFGNVQQNTSQVAVAEPIVYVSGYTGRISCPIPESSVNSIKSSIEDESFSSDKMNIAKQATKNRCITVSQVREIMSAFDFEDKKLEFAKYAYNRTHDVDNYYLINKDFDFSSNKESLNKYVESK